MSNKVVKLTERQLLDIVRNVINEAGTGERSYASLIGTTDPTKIANLNVLTQDPYKLPADQNNFQGLWVLTGRNNVANTFTNKNLSLFTPDQNPPPTKDYFAIEMRAYTSENAEVYNSKGEKVQRVIQRPIENVEPKTFTISGNQREKINSYYSEESVDPMTNQKRTIVWKVTKIWASGNGLLAFGRGLSVYQGKGIPNIIEIGLSQSERVSGSVSYNPSQIEKSFEMSLKGTSISLTAFVLFKNTGKVSMDKMAPKEISTSSYNALNLTQRIVNSMMWAEKSFIPEEKIQEYNSDPNMPKYDAGTINGIINSNMNLSDRSKNYYKNNYGKSNKGWVAPELQKMLDGVIKTLADNYVERCKYVVSKEAGPEYAERLNLNMNTTNYALEYRVGAALGDEQRIGTVSTTRAQSQEKSAEHERGK